jgi:hypothetical protein
MKASSTTVHGLLLLAHAASTTASLFPRNLAARQEADGNAISVIGTSAIELASASVILASTEASIEGTQSLAATGSFGAIESPGLFRFAAIPPQQEADGNAISVIETSSIPASSASAILASIQASIAASATQTPSQAPLIEASQICSLDFQDPNTWARSGAEAELNKQISEHGRG